ncbi:hypothetical protein GCM10007425_13970 [Lysinibacillus alkalisoli]|uniref:DUF2197 domain-containing protein n=1 Tax=Lysinibacillus alkalisoli TaxID=1911548 RepID=A0A917G3M2_9BACI|nr:YlaI family protein [Lysinibacillus alkalisoli]GGG20769.1 hypothetical protein GCM10007425_13970 [Lysinibacillus alkalisoli]
MRVKCVVCDTLGQIDDDSPMAKKLRNRPIHTYMCDECHTRITHKTEERLATGMFRVYKTSPLLDKEF